MTWQNVSEFPFSRIKFLDKKNKYLQKNKFGGHFELIQILYFVNGSVLEILILSRFHMYTWTRFEKSEISEIIHTLYADILKNKD